MHFPGDVLRKASEESSLLDPSGDDTSVAVGAVVIAVGGATVLAFAGVAWRRARARKLKHSEDEGDGAESS